MSCLLSILPDLLGLNRILRWANGPLLSCSWVVRYTHISKAIYICSGFIYISANLRHHTCGSQALTHPSTDQTYSTDLLSFSKVVTSCQMAKSFLGYTISDCIFKGWTYECASNRDMGGRSNPFCTSKNSMLRFLCLAVVKIYIDYLLLFSFNAC